MPSGNTLPEFFYFDLGNVIVTFDHETACRRIAQLIGKTPDLVRAAVFTSGLQQRYELGTISEREFYVEFCDLTGSQPDFDALMRAGSEIFALDQAVMELVGRLHRAGCRIGVLSNTCASHWRYLTSGCFPGLPEYFELAVLSFQERCAKPERTIYQRAVERAGVAPERMFFVDDRPENVDGAVACGWDAVQFRNAAQLAAELHRRGIDEKT